MSVEISREEWLKALSEAEPEVESDPDVLTRAELMVMFGLGRTATQERLQRMIRNGSVVRTTKWIVDGAGRRQKVGAYRLVRGTK